MKGDESACSSVQELLCRACSCYLAWGVALVQQCKELVLLSVLPQEGFCSHHCGLCFCIELCFSIGFAVVGLVVLCSKSHSLE